MNVGSTGVTESIMHCKTPANILQFLTSLKKIVHTRTELWISAATSAEMELSRASHLWCSFAQGCCLLRWSQHCAGVVHYKHPWNTVYNGELCCSAGHELTKRHFYISKLCLHDPALCWILVHKHRTLHLSVLRPPFTKIILPSFANYPHPSSLCLQDKLLSLVWC